MKNKKETDVQKKKEHIKQVKAAKERKRGEPVFERQAPVDNRNKSFLIICEGKNTEPSYFDQFKLSTATIKTVGIGDNTFSLVQKAIKIRIAEEEKDIYYDSVWCIFDADPKPDNPNQLTNFINGIIHAIANNIEVAYSHQAFEYWLMLHFEDHQGGPMPRTDYHNKINDYLKPLGCSYEGKDSKVIDEDFFEQMLVIVGRTRNGEPITRQDQAIKRAERILKFHSDNGTSPEKAESSTTVFKLVEALRKHK